MVDDLEEAHGGGGMTDLVDNSGAMVRGSSAGEVHSGYFGLEFRSMFEVGKSLGRVNEELGDITDAGVDKAFDSDFGIIELLHCFHSVVGLGDIATSSGRVRRRRGRHGNRREEELPAFVFLGYRLKN